MKKIFCDRFGLHLLSETDFVVWDESQYEEALDKLADQSLDQSLVVRNPALFHWFDSAAKKNACSIIVLDPVTELEKLIDRTSLPALVKNFPERIIELELIPMAREMPINPSESARSWMNRVLLGSMWLDKESPDINQILIWLTEHDRKEFHPVVLELIDQQLESWTQIKDHGIDEVFKWLRSDPFGRARVAAWAQMLGKYPADRVASWFQHDEGWNSLNLISVLPKFLSDINIHIKLPEGVSVFLRSFLEKEWERSPLIALSYMTGNLEVEKSFLLQRLQSCLYSGQQLQDDIYREISKFDDFPEAIELAKQLTPAQAPSSLSSKASMGTLQLWLREEYLPYYGSCSLLNSLEKTEPYIEEFENWLRNNYQNHLINGEGMAYRQTSQLKTKVGNGPILLYIFDGLDYLTAIETLLPIIIDSGIYPVTSVMPHLTFLPTETFITKPTLACGWMNSQLPPERPDATFYRKLVQNSFGFSDLDINCATDQDATLLELVQNPAKFYLYLDNQLDREYLHSALNPFVRRKKYKDHLKKQAKEIIDAANVVKEQQGSSLNVCICSDHGYTELPQNVSTIAITGSKKVKTRSAFVDDCVRFEEDDDVWILQPDLFGIHQRMAISKGYRCFGKKPKGATHGSYTPQEISVPWFLFSFQKPEEVMPLTIVFEGEIYRRRKDNNLRINFSNPNEFSMSIIEVNIEDFEMFTLLPIQIHPGQVGIIDAIFDASSINDSELTFKVEYVVSHQYGQKKDIVRLKIKTKGAMLNEFDDDFDI